MIKFILKMEENIEFNSFLFDMKFIKKLIS